MNPKISILGCGWLGFALAIQLKDKGYRVFGSTTSPHKIEKLESIAITPFLIDIHKPEEIPSEFLTSKVLIISITSKEVVKYKKFITKIEKSNIRHVIFISSTSVYPLTNGIVTEKTPTKDVALVSIENLLLSNANFDSTILRFGGLFGYDRNPGRFFKPGNLIDNPQGYVNLIHRDDAIRVIAQIILKNKSYQLLNACASSHPRRKSFYLKETKKIGKVIRFNKQSNNNYKIVSSQKLINALDFEFCYNDLMNINDNHNH